ncbi:inner membrane amino-acid ABC transporter permease protein YhdY [bacterium BMS3Bbin02]|nr:inner membrane amino-acid ABC transporter permease protein YhdY [bacterium BMS3Bbin02]
MTDHLAPLNLEELAPEKPPSGPVLWIKENLASTWISAILSILAIALTAFSFRGAVQWLFAADRRWDAVIANMKLLAVQSYPEAQMMRVWVSVGIVFVLIAAILAWNRIGGKIAPRKLSKVLLTIGITLLLVGLLMPAGSEKWETLGNSLLWKIGGVLLLGIGVALTFLPDERRKAETIPIMGLVAVALFGIIGFLKTATMAFPIAGATLPEDPAERLFEPTRIADSTANPWTAIILAAMVTFVVMSWLRSRSSGDGASIKRVIISLIVASFPVIFLVILRDPAIDEDMLVKFVVTGAVFAILGAVAVRWFGAPGAGESRRALASIVTVLAFIMLTFPGILPIPGAVTPFTEPFLFRLLFLTFALFSLAAPTFGGAGSALTRYVIGWVGTAVVITYTIIIVTTESTVVVPGNFFIGGLGITFLLSITAISLSFPLGVLLALGRTSSMPLFRMMSTAYIELVRGVPLITWLIVAFVMLPVTLPPGIELSGIMRALIFMTLFSAAYLAENVRGGLQSIGKGQAEAAQALGLSTLQMTVFITLPQALRAVIPALVGQVIAIFKDTSLVTIVGLFDFLHIARAAINQQSRPYNFIGVFLEPLLFAAAVYWIFTFTVSRMSLRLEKKLGVGER